VPIRSSTADASTASDGTAASTNRAGASGDDDVLSMLAPAQEGRPDPSTMASSATRLPLPLGAKSTGEKQAPSGVTAGGDAEVRALADRDVAAGSVGLRPVAVRIVANGSTPGAAASAPTAATPGTPGPASVSAEALSELAEFPDGGEGTAGVDISDLAASISRPLAGGSGDYSVQVSLHPPELGQVRALLSLQGDVLHVTLTPDHSTGFDALSDAMPALHEQLAGGGVEVHVTLGHPGDPEGGDGRGAPDAAPAGVTSSDDATPAASTSAGPMIAAGPGRIHLVL
jgi:flagellar hook-length control protein FliK